MEDFEQVEYLLNKSELEKLCSDFLVCVARVLAEFFSFMATLGVSVIPKHISHRFSASMKKKSVIIGLPVVPFNQ